MHLANLRPTSHRLIVLLCLAPFIPLSLSQADVPRIVSPDATCGAAGAGAGHGYICPAALPCCSSFGYCGNTNVHCLAPAGCQPAFSATLGACQQAIDMVTPSPDGTCGKQGAGAFGYRCAQAGYCCSMYGYCGNTTKHCKLGGESGCQRAYGFCAAE